MRRPRQPPSACHSKWSSDGTGYNRIENHGTIDAWAEATTIGRESADDEPLDPEGDTNAEANALATIQEVEATDFARSYLENDSLNSMRARAFANATGEEDVDAFAFARVAEQDAISDDEGETEVSNTGSMTAYAKSNANAEGDAYAEAVASGVDQFVSADVVGTATVTNGELLEGERRSR